MARIASLEAFWPHYLTEHRDPRSRVLHFVGTSLFFAAVGVSVVAHPVGFPVAMAGVGGAAWWGSTHTEARRPAFGPMVVMLILAFVASPIWMPAGVVAAYAAAWIGHFRLEKNRPATFEYPVWSFLCDFRMWSEMVRGRLWSGDPLEELGLRAPPDLDGAETPAVP